MAVKSKSVRWPGCKKPKETAVGKVDGKSMFDFKIGMVPESAYSGNVFPEYLFAVLARKPISRYFKKRKRGMRLHLAYASGWYKHVLPYSEPCLKIVLFRYRTGSPWMKCDSHSAVK